MEPDTKQHAECLAAAVRYLAAREHSRAELACKLTRKGWGDALVYEVLDELGGRNLQSDKRYARVLIESRQRIGYGPVYIRHYLKDKGVDAGLVDSLLDFQDPAWQKALSGAAVKKFGITRPAEYSIKAKQMNFLQRRGFTAEQIRRYYDGVDEDL